MSSGRALLLAIVGFAATTAVASEKLVPRNLRSPKQFDTSGCYLHLLNGPSEGYVFEWDFHDKAWINLGGADIRLHFVSSRGINLENWDGSVGDEEVATFSGPDVRVTVTMTLRSKCAPTDESCEAVAVDARVLVKKAKRSIVFQTHGICGT